MPYIFFSDPGHGWLRVKKTEIEPIKDKISPYSYMNGEYVYLEEDCDAPIFLTHKFGKDFKYKEMEKMGIIMDRHDEVTPIRDYDSYSPE